MSIDGFIIWLNNEQADASQDLTDAYITERTAFAGVACTAFTRPHARGIIKFGVDFLEG
jgi:hypothetical protein